MAKKKKASLGCLFWVALILLVLVVFFFNRERIHTVLDETGFRDYLFKQEPQDPAVKRVEPQKEEPEAKPEAEPEQPESTDNATESNEQPDVEITVDPPAEEETTSPEQPEKPLIDKRMRKSALYFVEVSDSGTIELKRIVRPVYYSDSPLTETLQALLKGLTAEELNQGLLNLIPQETELRKVWVDNGTAFLDFTEALRFNQFGSEGLHAQLQQIVYTATEFQTVDSVQILINGKKIDYLASEGIFVGEPLTRKDVAAITG